MKKLFALILTLLLIAGLAACAMAEDSTPTYEIGEGHTEFMIIVTEIADMNTKINIFIRTNEDNLMDALTAIDLIGVEKASWGYYVTSVLGIEATGSSYWSILKHNGSSFQDLSTPIQSTPLSSGNVYAFILY